MDSQDAVVLLVQLQGGEVVAVPFISRASADHWEDRHDFETVGRPRVVSARSLSFGQRMREREEAERAGR